MAGSIRPEQPKRALTSRPHDLRTVGRKFLTPIKEQGEDHGRSRFVCILVSYGLIGGRVAADAPDLWHRALAGYRYPVGRSRGYAHEPAAGV